MYTGSMPLCEKWQLFAGISVSQRSHQLPIVYWMWNDAPLGRIICSPLSCSVLSKFDRKPVRGSRFINSICTPSHIYEGTHISDVKQK